MIEHLRFLNPLLARVGRQIVESYCGVWIISGAGKLERLTYQAGWRLARRGEWEGLPAKATELDRLVARRARRDGVTPNAPVGGFQPSSPGNGSGLVRPTAAKLDRRIRR